jgi:glycosyltransferase involved in cell wall biosynthesis
MKTSTHSRPRVLIVLPWSPNLPGGVSVVVRSLISQWRKEGLFPTVMVSEWKASRPVVDEEGILNFRFTLLGSLSWLGLVKATLTAPVRLWRTWRLLRANKVSALNFHYPSLDAFGVAMLKRLGLFRGRLVLSFHGTDARAPASLLESRLWRWLLGAADEVTACSGSLARKMADVFNIQVDRVTVLYNGVDTTVFAPDAALRVCRERWELLAQQGPSRFA